MSVYHYKAVDAHGVEVSGEMEFPDRIHLLNKLSAMGYFVSSVTEKKSFGFRKLLERTGFSSYRVGRKSRIIFTRQMASLLQAGIPINSALTLISRQTEDKGLVDLVKTLKRSIEGGSAVSEALSKRRDAFSDAYIAMVEAGEISGMLAEVFEKLANLEETENERRESVKSAVAYPLILVIASVMGITFLLVAVFPTFVKIFSAANVTLPITTRAIIAISDFVRTNLVYLVLGVVSVCLFVKWISGRKKGELFLDRLKLRIPLFGKLLRKTAISTFTHTYQALNSSGVPVEGSLRISSRSPGNKVIEAAVLDARMKISDGATIADAFEETGEFPPLVVHMFSIGEESGNMDDMLLKLCEYYEKEITYAISRLTTAIEPILIGVMGFVIAFMYLSLITPMMQMMKVAKGGGI